MNARRTRTQEIPQSKLGGLLTRILHEHSMIGIADFINTPLQWGAGGGRIRRTVSTVLTPRLKPLKRFGLPWHDHTPLKWGVNERATADRSGTREITRLGAIRLG
jgi:hypothetical protein